MFAGLPPLMREGDQLRAGFTVRNLTQDRDSFTVTPTASALVDGKRLPLAVLGAQTVTLEPGEAKVWAGLCRCRSPPTASTGKSVPAPSAAQARTRSASRRTS